MAFASSAPLCSEQGERTHLLGSHADSDKLSQPNDQGTRIKILICEARKFQWEQQ